MSSERPGSLKLAIAKYLNSNEYASCLSFPSKSKNKSALKSRVG